MSDTPLFDRTLGDVLLRARREAERAQAMAALAARNAADKAAQVEQDARAQLFAAGRKAAQAARLVKDAERINAEARAAAADRLAKAEKRASVLERQERIRRALIVEEVEDRLRHELAHDAPPLPRLVPPIVIPSVSHAAPDEAMDAPPVPSMDDLLRPSAGVSRFLDTLLGPSSP